MRWSTRWRFHPRRPTFFTLDDLRRYGGNIKIIKDGERLENMKYYSLGKEVQIVDDMPTCVVDVALGQTKSLASPTSSPAPPRAPT